MTNKDKYLKEGVSVKELAKKLTNQICRWDELSYERDTIEEEIVNFLNEQVKPTLTEDERVILKNLDKRYKYIRRPETELFLKEEFDDSCSFIFRGYDHLFQFIKEGEEYEIAELLKGE